MTIWILTLVLLASLAGLGLRQGAIRVAFSLVGIIFGALLASPIGHLLGPIIRSVGLKNPIWAWMLGPLLVFLIVVTIFKIAGATVDRKTSAYYKHKASDTEWSMWDRMNHRLGLCLGVANGAVYLVLASFAISTPTYWTYQLGRSPAGENSRAMKILNRLGADLQSTGMNKVGAAVNSMPSSYYDAADIVGLIYNNPSLADRLSRYPDIITLAEKPELQDLANDADLARMREQQVPVSQLLEHPKVKAVLDNKQLLQTIWSTLTPDLKDLRMYLETGKSEKFDSEKILGVWSFNAMATTAAFRKNKPTVSLTEMKTFRQWMRGFSDTTFAAGPDHVAVVKGIPNPQPGNPAQTISLHGEWQPDGTDTYKLTFKTDVGSQDVPATIENGRLTLSLPGYALGFTKAE